MALSLYDIEPLLSNVAAGHTLLTPNARLARRISSQWNLRQSATGAKAWESLSVMPVEAWMLSQWDAAVSRGELPPKARLSAFQEQQFWLQAITAHEAAAGTFHLLRPEQAAKLAAEARDLLGRWQVNCQEPAIRQLFALEEDCRIYLEWLNGFEMRLEVNNAVTAGDCLQQLLQAGVDRVANSVTLVEVEDLTPLQEAVLAKLASTVKSHLAASEAPAACEWKAFQGRRQELHAAAQWAASRHREAPDRTLGVVLSESGTDRVTLEYLLRREFGCLGASYTHLPVNFSTGITLDEAPVVRHALAVLNFGLEHVNVRALTSLLQSRFLPAMWRSDELQQRLIKWVFDLGREQLSVTELRQYCAGMARRRGLGVELAECLQALHGMRELRRPALPSQWVERFYRVLDLLQWPGTEPLDSLEYQQVELWHRSLEEFAGLDGCCDPLDYTAALALLVSFCGQQISQPQTSDSAVQVLGPLEAAGLSFDELWVCGMQADSWPAPAQPNPLLPVSLQRQLSMPHSTAEREWRFSHSLWQQYARTCSRIVASYCWEEEGVPQLPSPLLAEIDGTQQQAPAVIDPLWPSQAGGITLERLVDEKAPAWTEVGAVAGGSALLEHQSHCPFRAFARWRLKVQPLPEPQAGLSAAQRGSLLHEALFQLWQRLSDHSALLALTLAQQRQHIGEAVATVLRDVNADLKMAHPHSLWLLEQQRLERVLDQWLDLERTRGQFAVSALEHTVELPLLTLTLRLKVDRIDTLADGSTLILDYKSGQCTINDWLGARPPAPQLLLYGSAQSGVSALAFAQVRNGECALKGLGSVPAEQGILTDIRKATRKHFEPPLDTWAALNRHWQSVLQELAQEFIDGEARVDPLRTDSCQWCGLQPLCRVAVAAEATECD
ncbi:MAG: PD-(D/E)XK nuclease family protein [Pseudomonadota bacterium]